MDEAEILNKIYKYSSISKLSFFFEVEEYKYVCTILDGINVVIENLMLYKENKKNLKIYKDDKETCNQIKDIMKYNEERINQFLLQMEEAYQDHLRKEGNI